MSLGTLDIGVHGGKTKTLKLCKAFQNNRTNITSYYQL